MKKVLLLLAGILCYYSQLPAQEKAVPDNIPASAANPKSQLQAANDLIKRVLKDRSVHFTTALLPAQADGKDHFEISRAGKKILLRGSSGVAIASALNYYLRHIAHCDITWNGTNLQLPVKLPLPSTVIARQTPYPDRYYMNYCTFNYTMSWWDWERWQQEIDWMAMNGINMPLALTGQNEILYRVYKRLGLSDEDLAGFFSGPAYFAWFWMGNLDAWGGPLPRSWMQSHEVLQQKILARERSLGMKPVLPAFSGHVPPAFKEKFSQAKLSTVEWSGKFPAVYILDPADPLFLQIGKLFIEEQTRAYGTDHLYSADTFNEVDPPTGDTGYIADISRKVYQSMAAADPEAVWVMQGWLFYFSRNFWKQPQVKALLDAVPDDKMIVLDLWTERHPVWPYTQAYYGKPWIWCMLHNFGQSTVLFGQMDSVAHNPSRDLNNPTAGRLRGLGLTMEGIEQNPVIYELMQENVWTDQPINLDDWLKGYARRRYGQSRPLADSAWQWLRTTVYADTMSSGGPKSILQSRPTFAPGGDRVNIRHTYANKDLAMAWKYLIAEAPVLRQSDGFQFDLVDLGRQVLANHAAMLHRAYVKAYEQKDLTNSRAYARAFLELIADLDTLTGTRKDFLLGRWLESAKAWGTNQSEKELYERNARNLITTWGDQHSRLHEYAAKQWSGLLNGFYKPRWEQFFAAADQTLAAGRSMDMAAFEERIKAWEWQWVNGHELYAAAPAGDPVAVSEKLYRKYFKGVLAAERPASANDGPLDLIPGQ